MYGRGTIIDSFCFILFHSFPETLIHAGHEHTYLASLAYCETELEVTRRRWTADPCRASSTARCYRKHHPWSMGKVRVDPARVRTLCP